MSASFTPRVIVAPGVAARCAAGAAAACGVHCLVAPFLVPVLPLLSVSESAEWVAFGVSLALAGGALLLGPVHGRVPALTLVLGGAVLWSTSLLGVFEPAPEALTTAAGSLVFAAGMLWSARVCRGGECSSNHRISA